MEQTLYEKFLELERKVKGETIAVLCDSPALAKEHGVRLGVTVMLRKPPDPIASVDDCLKYMQLDNVLRASGVL